MGRFLVGIIAKFRKYNWQFLLLIFILHQIWAQHYRVVLLDSYLDDLIYFPIVFGFSLHLLHYIDANFKQLPLFYTLPIVILQASLFEIAFPLWSANFTFDILDFVAYALGFIYFQLFQNSIDSSKTTYPIIVKSNQ